MPVDPMDDIELRSVQLQFPNARGSILEACEQRRVPTDKGDVHVAIQGDTAKPAIVTYHDLGLNCEWPSTLPYQMYILIHFSISSRRHQLCWILQLSSDARFAGELLCLPCDGSWAGGGCPHFARGVRIYCLKSIW